MYKEYLTRLKDTLTSSPCVVPDRLCRVYTVVSLLLERQGVNLTLLDKANELLLQIKGYLAQGGQQPDSQLLKELLYSISSLLVCLPKSFVSMAAAEYFLDQKATELAPERKGQSNNQMANLVWEKCFKSQSAVPSTVFWQKATDELKSHPFFGKFITDYSIGLLVRLSDPQQRFYVTKTDIAKVFFELMDPNLLQRLEDATLQKSPSSAFKSNHSLVLSFHCQDMGLFSEIIPELKINQPFKVSGKEIIVRNSLTQVHYPPTILFGSHQDADLRIKSKFISRKQFVIVEDQAGLGLVCLSNSNHTAVSYKKEIPLQTSTMIKVGRETIEILSCGVIRQNLTIPEDDSTIDSVPVEASPSQKAVQMMLSVLIVSGPRMGETISLRGLSCQIPLANGNLRIFLKQDTPWVDAGCQILCKTANEVVQGKMSSKIRLESGMKIHLDGCHYQIH